MGERTRSSERSHRHHVKDQSSRRRSRSPDSRHKRSRRDEDDDDDRVRGRSSKHRDSDKPRETSQERQARKLAKRAAREEIKAREEANRLAAAELSVYSSTDNPFNDANLTQQFVWNKKQEQEKKAGLTREDARLKDQQRRIEAKVRPRCASCLQESSIVCMVTRSIAG